MLEEAPIVTAPAVQETQAVAASFFKDELDKAFEKAFNDYIGDYDYFYVDLPSGLTQDQQERVFGSSGVIDEYDKYNKRIDTLEDFKRAQEVEKEYPWAIYSDIGDTSTQGIRNAIEENVTSPYYTSISGSIESLVRDFENGRIPEEFIEAAEEKLRELDLFRFVGYNPNQLALFDAVDPLTKNRMDMQSEYQNGTLKISVLPNGSKYFVLLDGRILDANPKSLGNESVTDPDMRDMILDKAVVHKKTC